MAKKQPWVLQRTLPSILLIGGAIGVLASVLLSIEVFNKLKNPHFVPICNLNPVLSCTSVASSHQAHAFGFPNYFIGIAGYAVLATVGLALLAGAQFKRWFWLGIEGGLLFAFGLSQARCFGIQHFTICGKAILRPLKNSQAPRLLRSVTTVIYCCFGF
jgi:uncharacterized membrane protein